MRKFVKTLEMRFVALFYIFILFAGLPALAADELTLEKGPFLHLTGDKMQVRLQARNLQEPVLEWREEVAEKEKSIKMRPDTLFFWEAELPFDAALYRITDRDLSTPWVSVAHPGKPKIPFVFVAYGDNRSGGGDARVHQILLQNIEKENPSFVINTGDIVFNGGQSQFWAQFFREGKKLFASVPFQPSIGNHDLSRSNQYVHHFDLGENDRTYYYFEYGHAEFIALDTTQNFSPKSPQYEFLKDRLEKIKGKSPIVVFMHHPAYSFSTHGSHSKVQAYLVPLFEKYGVDLVLSGHDHNYQRFGPINGVTYIVTGGGGGPLYSVKNNPLLKNYKVVYHYVTFQVGEKSLIGTMKYKQDVADDVFEIVYREKEPQKEGVGEKEKP